MIYFYLGKKLKLPKIWNGGSIIKHTLTQLNCHTDDWSLSINIPKYVLHWFFWVARMHRYLWPI